LQQEIQELKQILEQSGYNSVVDEEFLPVSEVAEMLKMGKSTVWLKTKEDPAFPKPVKVGRATRWRKTEVIKYMTGQVR
jgi:predicted DNA-binding transcriptional regulator AlpA